MQEECNLNDKALWDLFISLQMQARMLIMRSSTCAELRVCPSRREARSASGVAAAGVTSGRVRPRMQLKNAHHGKAVVPQCDGLEQGQSTGELVVARDTSAWLVRPSPGQLVLRAIVCNDLPS